MPDQGSARRTIVVLTALEVEFEAVAALLPPLAEKPHASGVTFHETELRDTGDRVLLAVTGQGNQNSGAVSERAVAEHRPHILLLVGIAGRLHDDLEPGTVVVSTRVYAYHGGVAASEGHRAAPRSWEPDLWLLERARATSREESWRSRVRFRPTASGEQVVDGRETATSRLISLHFADAAAVDKEGAGVMLAASQNRIGALVIRAISDLADGTKLETDRTGNQQRAAAIAADFAVALLRGLPPGGPSAREPSHGTFSAGGHATNANGDVTGEAERLRQAADVITRRQQVRWLEEAPRLGLREAESMAVRWERAPDAVDRCLPTGGLARDLYRDIYIHLEPRRLVILGDPGAGKTGALLHLWERMLACCRTCPSEPVPVLFPLADWDPRPPRSVEARVVELIVPLLPDPRHRLRLPTRRSALERTARDLFRSGRIALLCDGLDEMPERLRGEALRRLDAEFAGRPLVLTSRVAEYAPGYGSGELGGAAVVRLLPLPPGAAADAVRKPLGTPRADAWSAVADHLTRQPESTLAEALDSPLIIEIAKRIYDREGADPADLLGAGLTRPQQVSEQILAGFLDTAYGDLADERRDASIRRLAWIADRMDGARIFYWWQIPAWLPEWRSMVGRLALMVSVYAACAAVVIGLMGAAYHPGADYDASRQFSMWLLLTAFGSSLLVAGLLVDGTWMMRVPTSGTRNGRRQAGVRLAILRGTLLLSNLGPAGAILAISLLSDPALAADVSQLAIVLSGLGLLVLGWLALLWERVAVQRFLREAERSPGLACYDADVRRTLRTAVLGFLVLGVPVAAVAVAINPEVEVGALLWAGGAPAVALAVFGRPSVQVVGAQFMLPGGPVSLRKLLGDAVERDVLRPAGHGFRFRHARLQDHLARRHRASYGRPLDRSRLHALGDRLAHEESREAAGLDPDGLPPIRIERRPPARGRRPEPSWSANLDAGVARRLLGELKATPRGAPVVVRGAPGSGRTATLLVLRRVALEHRAGLPEVSRRMTPVPVYLTPDDWDPRTTSLREWVATVLARRHPYVRARGHGRDAVRRLLDEGLLLLLIDDLDRMPGGLSRVALRRLRQESCGVQVVVACDALGDDPAEALALLPVRPADGLRFLAAGEGGRCWAERFADPTGLAARALRTPSALELARAVGHRRFAELSARTAGPGSGSGPEPALEARLRGLLAAEFVARAYGTTADGPALTLLEVAAERLRHRHELHWWDVPTWGLAERRRQVLQGVVGGGLTLAALQMPSAVGSADDSPGRSLFWGVTVLVAIGVGVASARMRLVQGVPILPFLPVRMTSRRPVGPAAMYQAARRLLPVAALEFLAVVTVGVTVWAVMSLSTVGPVRVATLAGAAVVLTPVLLYFASPVCSLAVLGLLMAGRGRPRPRIPGLLEQARARGVLREVGDAYQFSNSDVRRLLAARHDERVHRDGGAS